MDGEAFLEFLFKLELAVAASRGGDQAGAETFWFDASLASGDVFPLGSPESEALGVLLSAVDPMVTGAAP
jgi:hypothetical protein